MDSKEKEQKLRDQIQSLHSGNKSVILSTIQELRSHGKVSILPDLLQVMLVQEDPQIREEIARLLNDLKDQAAAEILAQAVGNPEFESIQATLAAACWQNGLSYGKYLKIFAEVLVSGSYEAALEAFTVLEEAMGEVEVPERMKLAGELKSRLQKVDPLKKPLIEAMVIALETYGS